MHLLSIGMRAYLCTSRCVVAVVRTTRLEPARGCPKGFQVSAYVCEAVCVSVLVASSQRGAISYIWTSLRGDHQAQPLRSRIAADFVDSERQVPDTCCADRIPPIRSVSKAQIPCASLANERADCEETPGRRIRRNHPRDRDRADHRAGHSHVPVPSLQHSVRVDGSDAAHRRLFVRLDI